jgi:hypothetical protein
MVGPLTPGGAWRALNERALPASASSEQAATHARETHGMEATRELATAVRGAMRGAPLRS